MIAFLIICAFFYIGTVLVYRLMSITMGLANKKKNILCAMFWPLMAVWVTWIILAIMLHNYSLTPNIKSDDLD